MALQDMFSDFLPDFGGPKFWFAKKKKKLGKKKGANLRKDINYLIGR